MFWPLVLPAKITFVILFATICFVTYKAPKWKWKTIRFVVFVLSSIAAVIAFIPVCIAVSIGIDFVRFGLFTHQDFDSVNDFRVERYLPETAEEISLYKYHTGYQAKFTISQKELDQWYSELCKNFREYHNERKTKNARRCKPIELAVDNKIYFPSRLLDRCKKIEPIPSDDMLSTRDRIPPTEPDSNFGTALHEKSRINLHRIGNFLFRL